MTYKVALSSMTLAGKIPPGDPLWHTFNGSFRNVELDTYQIGESVYEGRPLTTWHANGWRTTANYTLGQHLGLDMDTEDERSTLPALLANKFISRHAAIVHTTTSHTPEAPRARVLFLLDAPIMQATNYALAAAALLWLFGSADRACKDAVRFWYGAAGCDLEFVDHELPLATIKQIIRQYQATGQRERQRHEAITHTTDQQEVADALRRIPAWGIDYDEWVAVLMALHREYGAAGLGMAESWAQGAQGEVERKWRSFKADGNPAGAVGLGTVFALAKRFGWERQIN